MSFEVSPEVSAEMRELRLAEQRAWQARSGVAKSRPLSEEELAAAPPLLDARVGVVVVAGRTARTARRRRARPPALAGAGSPRAPL